MTLTNGTNIVFKGDGSVATCTGNGTATGAFAAQTTGNANFNTVLNGFKYDGGPHTITLNNLAPGQVIFRAAFCLGQPDRQLGNHPAVQLPGPG